MIPMWGQSQLEFSALTDWPLQDVHYQQSLAQFAATGGATGPRATCVAGSPSTLPFSHLAPRCHRVTRDATRFQLENSHFCSYQAVTTHIGSSTCQPGLSLCSTDHRVGPRIMRQDLSALQGHGQCDPPQTPVQVREKNRMRHRTVTLLENRMRHRTVIFFAILTYDNV